MPDPKYFYDPRDGHGLPHDPFKAIVAPRVIGWISTHDGRGNANLAPYSFFGAFSSDPKVIGFSSEGYKDTIRNIEQTGEFTWNLASRRLVEQMNLTASLVNPEINEFELAGLAQSPGRNVSAPYVSEAPAALECKLLNVLRLKDLAGSNINNWVAFGQVVGVHIRGEFLQQGKFDLLRADPVMRAGYRGDYAVIDQMFELLRPTP